MRDEGLQKAIKKMGGVSALARMLCVSQPSVSGWRRVPASRVLEVERLTGVGRHVLRPDLYGVSASLPDHSFQSQGQVEGFSEIGQNFSEVEIRKQQGKQCTSLRGKGMVDPVDFERAQVYRLLSRLLFFAPDDAVLTAVSALECDVATPFGLALNALVNAAREAKQEEPAVKQKKEETLHQAFFTLFVGVGRGELLPFASYYRTGFLYERPLMKIREVLAELGWERPQDLHEPEDHLGFLCMVMAELIESRADEVVDQQVEALADVEFFTAHIAPWAGRFFADLAEKTSEPFYRALGGFGEEFMRIEGESLTYEATLLSPLSSTLVPNAPLPSRQN